MLYLIYEIYYITLYIIYMIYFEGFVLYQLATQWYTQWYIEIIFMIDHGYMQAFKRFVDSQIDSSCLWIV